MSESVFPSPDVNHRNWVEKGSVGLTTRELFAAMAMQSLILLDPDGSPEIDCSSAVGYADRLIAALEKSP